MPPQYDPERSNLDRAEELFAEFMARVEAGEAPKFDELVRSHPALLAELEQLHLDWLRHTPVLEKAVPAITSAVDRPNVAVDWALNRGQPTSRLGFSAGASDLPTLDHGRP